MNFGLIIVGDEILSGKRQDKHLPKVIDLLAARGLSLAWARYVGDDPDRIAADLRDAFEGAARDGDIVFSCGGIGATPDDHTRQSAGRALGRPLVLHPEARDLIHQRMREVAAEQGQPFEPDRDDNVHRLNMGVFPEGAEIIPNPYNRIAGFSVKAGDGGVWFVPGFPVMAWPMIEWVLDERLKHLHRTDAQREQSVIVFGAMEATLTPLMEEIEARFAGIKVFSLPSVDHPEWGRHIELGVKGTGDGVAAAYRHLLDGLHDHGAKLGPELVR
ncbi:competence/damage-inducible protein A [Piscinibacter gummiphilus]|uniref:Damage-inducible protein n=1 Tax=Piscinibacter gummiphilus TaxID=946333 RepID=A0A1W6L6E7_9BURK|nr:molybdopterin-binding protein [Piscinibacter gummiphilus]ARN19911.1 damage-inducible protein [Piscinibacter gummiphilus]ATU64585.1 competence/damage-inducible protein A [Piscinibacter gummiphilus]GLS94999.1 damage-inducible protein [Piscinibacter gummiphilus]